MVDKRRKNGNWTIGDGHNAAVPTLDAQLAVMMDIRDELQTINRKLDCHNIPPALRALHELGIKLRREKRRKRRNGR